jgi:hypothetical protein
MIQLPQHIEGWVELLLFLLAALVIGYGMLTALAMLVLGLRGRLSLRLLAATLLLFALTIGREAMLLAGGFDRWPSLRFLPLSLSVAIGPMFFLYVKARLYPAFRVRKADLKHFLPAIGQFSAYLVLFLQPTFRQQDLWEGMHRYYIHPLENLLFVLTGWIYLFFAWRFVRHELSVRTQPTGILYALRLKRTAKVLALFLGFYAGYLVDDTIRRLLLLKAQSDLTLVSYASFAALLFMLLWLSLFAWLSEYWWPRRHKLSLTRLVHRLEGKE